MAKPKTAEEIVRLATPSGHVVYAHGGGDPDLPGLQSAIDRGLIVFVRDVSTPADYRPAPQKRSEYKLTPKGEKLRSGK